MNLARDYIDSFPARTGRRVYWFFAGHPLMLFLIAFGFLIFIFTSSFISNGAWMLISTILIFPAIFAVAGTIVFLLNHPGGLVEKNYYE